LSEEIIEYWSRASSGYSKYAHNSFSKKWEKKAWQEIFTEAIGKERLKILDVGTGPGIIALQLAEMGHDVTGVDLAEGMLEEANKNAKRYGINVTFEIGDAQSLPFPDNSFDAVVSRWVLWTLPEPERALREWHRVVKPGGKIIYIDGNWHSDLATSRKRKAWYFVGRSITAITELRNPWKGKSVGKKTRDSLWSTNASRPTADIEMIKKLGYSNVMVKEGLKKRTLRGLQYLKYGFWSDYFLVNITKDDI
jgi:ubiquinone/menaquinone biosynthesis C-methylase UbiE